jgi:hypothetical protein
MEPDLSVPRPGPNEVSGTAYIGACTMKKENGDPFFFLVATFTGAWDCIAAIAFIGSLLFHTSSMNLPILGGMGPPIEMRQIPVSVNKLGTAS